MNIVVTINETYYYPLFIMLNSLFGHHPGVVVHVFLLYSDVTQESRDSLKELCEKKGNTFTDIYVSEELFADAPVTCYFPKEMYYRILAAQLLPQSIDRVLYLDPDTIIVGNIMDFYTMDMEHLFFAGSCDRPNAMPNDSYKRSIGYTSSNTYINSGVLLCNLKELRKQQDVQEVFREIEENGKKYLYPDQEIINILYTDKIKEVPQKYNFDLNNVYWWEWLFCNVTPFLFPKDKKPAICHFLGPQKPWNRNYTRGGYQYYWKEERKYTTRGWWYVFIRSFKIPFCVVKSTKVYFAFLLRHMGIIKKKSD